MMSFYIKAAGNQAVIFTVNFDGNFLKNCNLLCKTGV